MSGSLVHIHQTEKIALEIAAIYLVKFSSVTLPSDLDLSSVGLGVEPTFHHQVYIHIRVMPDKFLLKSVVFKLISKEISWAVHEYMNIHLPPPPPINALATALQQKLQV